MPYDMACLIDIAMHGRAARQWSDQCGGAMQPLAAGALAIREFDGDFYYRHGYLLEMAGAVAGLMLAHPPADYAPPSPFHVGAWAQESLFVSQLAIRPEWQGAGLGSYLIGVAEKLAIARGLSQVGLTVAPDNIRAKSLYTKLGFKVLHKGTVDESNIIKMTKLI